MNSKWSGWKTRRLEFPEKMNFCIQEEKNLHNHISKCKKDEEWELIICFGKTEVIAMFDKYNFKKWWEHNPQFSQSVLNKEWQSIKLKH